MKNITKSAYGAIDSLTAPILMLLATPIFLNYLGIEGYATWVLINSIIASLSLFNFGGTDVVVKFVSSNRGVNSKNSTREVFGTVFSFQLIVLLAIYVLFLIIEPIVSQNIASSNLLTFMSILYVAIPVFLIKQLEQLLYAFFRGYEQFGHTVIISSISKILFFLTQILIAISTKSVTDVFYGALAVSVLLFLAQALYIKIIHRDDISFSDANIRTARSLLSFGGWNWLSSVTSMLTIQSDKWLVSGLLSLKTFGIYSIGVLIFNQLRAVVGTSFYWVFPEISKDNLNKKILAKKYWKLLFYVCIVSLFISISLSNLSGLFQLWLGDRAYQDSQYYINTFLLLFPLFTLNIISHLYLLGLGLAKQKFFADVVSLSAKLITIYLVISVFNVKEWVLFFMVFIAIEFIAYAVIISKNLPIRLVFVILFLLLQMAIVFIRLLA